MIRQLAEVFNTGNQLLTFDIAKLDMRTNHVVGRQGDGFQKSVDVQILAEGHAYDFSNIAKVGFKGIKPDEKIIIDFDNAKVTDAKNGIFTYHFPEQCFTTVGSFKDAFFVVIGYDDTLDSTVQFSIDVLENDVDKSTTESDEYISPLKKS